MIPIADLVAKLPLAKKIELLSGLDFWHTIAIPEIGLQSMRMSDGPSGVRGESFDETKPSISFPSASSLSASWDTELAYSYGQAAGSEAVDKEVQVLLGPTINLHRSPLGGRHFEAYSEDPILTGELASAFVKGVQGTGVAACPKHYVANDSETDRFNVDVRVDEQTLHELYMRPFEIIVKNAKPWVVMSSYNSVNGFSMSQSPLLDKPLREDWGFEGVVVSDWTAVRTVESANFGQDLAMPGPKTPWNAGLAHAVQSGQVAEDRIDEKVERILQLARRVGALDKGVAHIIIPKNERKELARTSAEAGMVLLRNENVLPIALGSKIAVLGDNANRARTQGGGSAQVITEEQQTPLEAIRAQFGVENVSYSLGAEMLTDCAVFRGNKIRNPHTLLPGARVEFKDEAGAVIDYQDRSMTFFIWNDELDFWPSAIVAEFDLDLRDLETEDFFLGAGTVNPFSIEVDGEVLFSRTSHIEMHDLAAAILQPDVAGAPFRVNGRSSVRVKVTLTEPGISLVPGAISLMIGEIARKDDQDKLIDAAVEKALEADLAIVVVGTTSNVESEGFDRSSISLPGSQDALVRAVARANPRTIVVVNSGAPVDMPWRNEVAGILIAWFGGQEMGQAMSNVLSGLSEPAGRLPTSWVMQDEGKPLNTTPDGKNQLHYKEGLDIGYRALSDGLSSIDFPIGSGLGYGSWILSAAEATVHDNCVSVIMQLENLLSHQSKGFAAVFASKSDSENVRPRSWLVGWTRTVPKSGLTKTIIEIPMSYFETWNRGWSLEPGKYELLVVVDPSQAGIRLEVDL